jgi:hypothetical protein
MGQSTPECPPPPPFMLPSEDMHSLNEFFYFFGFFLFFEFIKLHYISLLTLQMSLNAAMIQHRLTIKPSFFFRLCSCPPFPCLAFSCQHKKQKNDKTRQNKNRQTKAAQHRAAHHKTQHKTRQCKDKARQALWSSPGHFAGGAHQRRHRPRAAYPPRGWGHSLAHFCCYPGGVGSGLSFFWTPGGDPTQNTFPSHILHYPPKISGWAEGRGPLGCPPDHFGEGVRPAHPIPSLRGGGNWVTDWLSGWFSPKKISPEGQ